MDIELQNFVREHAGDDVNRLLFSKGKWPGIDIDLAVNTIEGRRRIMVKVPSWGERFDLLYPTRLCTEQCSSSATATYKVSILKRLFEGQKFRIADMTGGLGVDSWYFSSIAESVFYNEGDKLLSDSVRKNFQTLGTMNIKCGNHYVEPGNVAEVLGDFEPDIVFMDPARRSSSGKKVFLIEDCQPDILNLKNEIFGICRYIMVKLSPMADISMVVGRLGHVVEVHTVASYGECKELLILMDRECDGKNYRLCVHECGNCSDLGQNVSDPGHSVSDLGQPVGTGKTLQFQADEERNSSIILPKKQDLSGLYLFEPGKALSKAGVFNTLCQRFGLVRLGRSTNLYLLPESSISKNNDNREGEAGKDHISSFGKVFRIEEDHQLDNKILKELGKAVGWADVSARNIPMTSEALSKKLGLSVKNAQAQGKKSDVPGAKPSAVFPHIFGIRIDWSDSASENRILLTERR